jgi:hypothetical protein
MHLSERSLRIGPADAGDEAHMMITVAVSALQVADLIVTVFCALGASPILSRLSDRPHTQSAKPDIVWVVLIET